MLDKQEIKREILINKIEIRPDEELREWLEEERWDNDNGQPESNSALVIRKLRKLMKLERQGY